MIAVFMSTQDLRDQNIVSAGSKFSTLVVFLLQRKLNEMYKEINKIVSIEGLSVFFLTLTITYNSELMTSGHEQQ